VTVTHRWDLAIKIIAILFVLCVFVAIAACREGDTPVPNRHTTEATVTTLGTGPR
jgi:hypothetical protein